MIARLIQVIWTKSVSEYVMAIGRCFGVRFLVALLMLCVTHTAIGADVDVYPYQPVVLSVPHSADHLAADFSTEAVITSPGGQQATNRLARSHLLGVSSNETLFAVLNAQTNYFVVPGVYQVEIESVTQSVEVLQAQGADSAVVEILDNPMLYRVMFAMGNASVDQDLKAKCQQVLDLSPTGEYAVYATAYLGIDDLYADLAEMYESATAPDFSTVGADIVGLAIPEGHLRWTILYHKGYAFGIRQDIQDATTAFTALTSGLSHSPWSENAEQFLSELTD